jgi:DNA replication initiation complex subunit (GINS family)
MNEDEINYRVLRKIQDMEKNSPVLTTIENSFYIELKKYLDNLDNRLKEESSSQKQTLLKDEILNTKKITKSIYEQREKKILLAAITKARGGNPDLKNMIDIEKNLFNSILTLMEYSRKQYLEEGSKENKSIEQKKNETKEEPRPVLNQSNTNPIVRVKEDIPEFIGTNEKKYNLRKNDILSLPEDMSDMLSKRGVVEKIKK